MEYPLLIAGRDGDYGKGSIAKALQESKKLIGNNDAETLERNLARLLAYSIKENPHLISPGQNIRLDIARKVIVFVHGGRYSLSQMPNNLIEYGPGIAALKRIPQEIRAIKQTILIENNIFVNELLIAFARLYNIPYPQIIGREDGIVSATQELLESMNAKEHFDMIIMSMVHTAGKETIEIGIEN